MALEKHKYTGKSQVEQGGNAPCINCGSLLKFDSGLPCPASPKKELGAELATLKCVTAQKSMQ